MADEDDEPQRVMRTKEGYVVTPESIAIESLGFKMAQRADVYLKRLEAVSTAQERQARRSLWAASASAVCAALLLAATVLPGDNRDTTYAHCQMVVTTTPSPSQSLLSMCMRAAGYRDICSPGAIPECFAPGSLIMRIRDALR